MIIVITIPIHGNTLLFSEHGGYRHLMKNRAILHTSSYYKRIVRPKGVAVYEIENGMNAISSISEKGLYKICLLIGNGIHYHDEKEKDREGAILAFEKPHSPHASDLIVKAQQGFACVFTEGFLKYSLWSACTQPSQMPDMEGPLIYFLNPKQKDFVAFLFRRMLMEQHTAYVFKNELLHNYIHLIFHEAFKLQPSPRLN